MLCSGGSDSVAAAHFLKTRGFNLFIIHVNQKLLPSDTTAAQRVAEFCYDFNLSFQILTPKNKMNGRGIEDSCRHIRYGAIREFCKSRQEEQFRHVCAAHTLNDAVESYINRMFNGELEYAPIPPICAYPETIVFRPFLQIDKEFFKEYNRKQGLEKYITEDPLNYDTKLRRAFIRHKVIPIIETHYQGLNTIVKKIMNRHMKEKMIFLPYNLTHV